MANLNNDILHIIFQCINVIAVSYMVYRRKNSIFLFKEEGSLTEIKTWTRKVYKHLPCLPILQMQFFQKDFSVEKEDCFCINLPNRCYSITLGSIYIENNKNIYNTLFLGNSHIKVRTISLFIKRYKNVMFCPELGYYEHCNLYKAYALQNTFSQIFNSSTEGCLIILLNQNIVKKAAQVLTKIIEWFPKHPISVWGGIEDSLSICTTKSNTSVRYEGEGLAFIFLSSKNMKIWSLRLDNKCHDEVTIKRKYINFKNNIKLNKNSIAFMYTPRFRFMEYKNKDSEIFKQTFPEIPLFYAGGTAGLGGNLKKFVKILNGLAKKPRSRLFRSYFNTTIMIITY